jgi:hypothetical protein
MIVKRTFLIGSGLGLLLLVSGALHAGESGSPLQAENPPQGPPGTTGSESAGPDAASPESPEGEASSLHPYGFRQIGRDARYLVTRPFHLDPKGWMKVAATFGTTAILYADRELIRDMAQERRTESGDDFFQKPRLMGKGAFAPSLALISYGASFATHDDREKETAVLLLESMAFSAVLVGVGQWVLATERPEDGNDIDFFGRRGHGVSGDAALAASVVPVLKNQYLLVRPGDGGGLRAWKRTATGLLYTGAFLTGYQRINNDKHWAPDVFLGLVTGFTVGQILCDSHDETRREQEPRLALTAVPGGIGLRIRLR